MEVLRWHLDHADRIEGYRRYQELTGCVPTDLSDAPRLKTMTISAGGISIDIEPARIQLAWRGFYALTGSRAITMGGVGPIPYFQILAYLDENEVDDPDERRELFHLIGRMDQEYLAYSHKPKGS